MHFEKCSSCSRNDIKKILSLLIHSWHFLFNNLWFSCHASFLGKLKWRIIIIYIHMSLVRYNIILSWLWINVILFVFLWQKRSTDSADVRENAIDLKFQNQNSGMNSSLPVPESRTWSRELVVSKWSPHLNLIASRWHLFLSLLPVKDGHIFFFHSLLYSEEINRKWKPEVICLSVLCAIACMLTILKVFFLRTVIPLFYVINTSGTFFLICNSKFKRDDQQSDSPPPLLFALFFSCNMTMF